MNVIIWVTLYLVHLISVRERETTRRKRESKAYKHINSFLTPGMLQAGASHTVNINQSPTPLQFAQHLIYISSAMFQPCNVCLKKNLFKSHKQRLILTGVLLMVKPWYSDMLLYRVITIFIYLQYCFHGYPSCLWITLRIITGQFPSKNYKCYYHTYKTCAKKRKEKEKQKRKKNRQACLLSQNFCKFLTKQYFAHPAVYTVKT